MNLVSKLALYLEKSESEVIRFLSDAPNKYRVYKIPKRSHGHRIIAQPSKELKEYQRAFLELYEFPVHDSAMAYCKGKGIKENALAHSKNSYLLKTDLENFFNSITPPIFWQCMEKCASTVPQFTKQEKVLVEKLIFWCPSKDRNGKLVLSIGAPSSPAISNFCLYQFDDFMSDVCYDHKITYTRYADDLTFSTNEKDLLHTIINSIQYSLNYFFSNSLKLNHSKTVFSSRAHNRHVTGITINNHGRLSLGRERKRYIKHLVNQFKYNQLSESDIFHLQGLLSFARHIEPKFIFRLKDKYTNELVQRIYEAGNEQQNKKQ
ncbi:retron St85 family RNA-directed DNA polymerase [Vibrio coralliilyticus]|uniref:retron St85 family RNA-directed DNA polymerase n=1 Tax=Vibrio coralliilyticus TaxID=190893 RepID=UPI0005128882|nr:retron St85 family RNA-directed DNA polymerase [Vibrio coralliilyticus]AIS53815.1 DNA polymerase [Vibrio coralliilyticus]